MAQNGSLLVRAFVSRAQIPVPGATVIVAAKEPDTRHRVIAIRTTDESGVAGPIPLTSPDRQEGLTPGNGTPFSSYTLIVEHPDFELSIFEDLQVFPDVETVQNVPMIPSSPTGVPQDSTTVVTPQPL